MNRVTIIGNLGQDAQVRVLDNGQAAISFSIGETERWKDQQGNKQERTEWFNCTLWRKSDQTAIAQYLKKGTKVMVEGRISVRPWQGQDGSCNASLEIRVNNVDGIRFLSALNQQQQGAPQEQPQTTGFTPEQMAGASTNPDDDLPF